MSEVCRKCGARCCTYFCFEIDAPDNYSEYEDIRWYLCHEGVSVHVEKGDWFISIANRCKMLGADDLCTAYDDRPLICRKYSMDNCDMTSGDYGYEAHFRTPEELVEYARKALGEKAYNRARAAARGRLKAKAAKKKRTGVSPTGRRRRAGATR